MYVISTSLFLGQDEVFALYLPFITTKTVVIAITRDFIATKTVVVTHEPWQLTATKTVVAVNFCAPHSGKEGKNSFRKWSLPRSCLQISDSPGVEVYHIVDFIRFD